MNLRTPRQPRTPVCAIQRAVSRLSLLAGLVLGLAALAGIFAYQQDAQPAYARAGNQADRPDGRRGAHVYIPFAARLRPPASPTATWTPTPTLTPTPTPQPTLDVCAPTGETYGSLEAHDWPPGDPPALDHPDLNLALRGYAVTNAPRELVDYGPAMDPNGPYFPSLFSPNRTPPMSNVYQVYDWNWSCNCPGDLLTNYPVTLAGLAVTPGEIVHTPTSGYDIGNGYTALVLYATNERITLKYTGEDNVIWGYTVHIEHVCVDPNLQALYNQLDAAGRDTLPALRGGQALGRAKTTELGVAIRDRGTFMDPRSKYDWWR